MSEPDRLNLDPALSAAQRWDWIARQVTQWAQRRGAALRDVTVLVPFVQVLGEARRAFAHRGGWLPRVETTRTLCAGLGPPAPWQPGQISFDSTVDASSAAAMLHAQNWAAAWERRDALGYNRAVGALVRTAQALVRAAQALAPSDRPAYWRSARERLELVGGPAATERALARIALEWAALAPDPDTDRLFAAAALGAWVQVRAGGGDALADALMSGAGGACLVVDTDAAGDDPFAALRLAAPPRWAVCDGFEHEAQCAAAQVIEHVRRAEVPVALVAQDRVLVRRVRALLERFGLRLSDETGWKLSTTRAAAQVMALLRSAGVDAGSDELLDWLKSGAADPDAVAALERACREAPVARVAALRRLELEPAAAGLWAWADSVLGLLGPPARLPLTQWLPRLRAALTGSGGWDALCADDAGAQVIAALRLGRGAAPAGATWPAVVGDTVCTLEGFAAWVDDVLEAATFVPAAPSGGAAQVVITPMGQAVLRSFAAVVFPGADDQRLGAMPAPHPLFDDALCVALALPHAAQQRQRERSAFVQLLAVPQFTLLRRRVDAGDPLSDSPLVQWLAQTLAQRGQGLRDWQDPRVACPWPARPLARSVAHAAPLLPQRLSASALEALRACPYRFYALHMLRLREDDELERELEKRDYGTWLHAVLQRFHAGRTAPAAAQEEEARLHELGRACLREQGIDDADFVPFAASFAALVPRYVAWLHERDRRGMRWLGGEERLAAFPPALEGVELYGVIDRIDAHGDTPRAPLELIDYKTGSAQGLRERLRQPQEDTQLAFYAALVADRPTDGLRAYYLALDGTKRLDEIDHPDVRRSAQALVQGLSDEWRRLRGGAGLVALGEGASCEHCAARGVCRRDHWAAPDARGAAA